MLIATQLRLRLQALSCLADVPFRADVLTPLSLVRVQLRFPRASLNIVEWSFTASLASDHPFCWRKGALIDACGEYILSVVRWKFGDYSSSSRGVLMLTLLTQPALLARKEAEFAGGR
jgi:hypothetical protein